LSVGFGVLRGLTFEEKNMSAYSSLKITRAKAQAELMKAVFGNAPDELLEEFMDRLLEPRLYNAVIVPDGEPNDDDVV
jgi:hypothetical protein